MELEVHLEQEDAQELINISCLFCYLYSIRWWLEVYLLEQVNLDQVAGGSGGGGQVVSWSGCSAGTGNQEVPPQGNHGGKVYTAGELEVVEVVAVELMVLEAQVVMVEQEQMFLQFIRILIRNTSWRWWRWSEQWTWIRTGGLEAGGGGAGDALRRNKELLTLEVAEVVAEDQSKSGGAGGSGIVVVKELNKASGVWSMQSQFSAKLKEHGLILVIP